MLETLDVVATASVACAAVAALGTAYVAKRLCRVSVVDVAWGLVLVAIAWVSCAVGNGSGRSLLLPRLPGHSVCGRYRVLAARGQNSRAEFCALRGSIR